MCTARSDCPATLGNVAVGGRNVLATAIFRIAITAILVPAWSAPPCGAEAVGGVEEREATPALIREMQFMLLRLGIDPGPIDGVAGAQTVKAVQRFQERSGLPVTEPVNGGKVSATLLARLRSEAARVIFEGEKKSEALQAAVAPARSAVEAPDRFAACPYSADDFRIGGTQYTPDSYLQEGFDGSTARAVKMLGDRLNEARQIASNIGGSALTEVQRQSHVLGYFSCRLKVEQALVK